MTPYKLADSLRTSGLVVAPGCHDVLGAKIIEKAGFEAVYQLGNGLSATLAYAQMMTAFAAHLKKYGTTAGAPQSLLTLNEYEALLDRSSYL